MNDVDDRSSRSVDPRSNAEAPLGPAPGLDPLSDVLRTVRLRGALFFLWDASSPFTTSVPSGDRFASILLPGARQIVSYHVVMEGACWGGLVGEAPLRLQAGDVLLVPRGDAYVMASSATGCRSAAIDEEAALEFFRLMANDRLPLEIEDGGGAPPRARIVCGFLGCDVQPFNPVASALPPIVRLGPAEHEGYDRLRSLADYALTEASEPGAGTDGVLTRLGELMFVEVVRRCLRDLSGDPGSWLSGLRDPIVGRCLALMHRRPADSWTLERLAGAVGTSRSGQAQRFADRIGEPPMRYLTRWRLQTATNLLESTTAKIATVAERVGYGSAPAFSRAFKRVVGVTPTEWRERVS